MPFPGTETKAPLALGEPRRYRDRAHRRVGPTVADLRRSSGGGEMLMPIY
jgi:hypothetical protein